MILTLSKSRGLTVCRRRSHADAGKNILKVRLGSNKLGIILTSVKKTLKVRKGPERSGQRAEFRDDPVFLFLPRFSSDHLG